MMPIRANSFTKQLEQYNAMTEVCEHCLEWAPSWSDGGDLGRIHGQFTPRFLMCFFLMEIWWTTVGLG